MSILAVLGLLLILASPTLTSTWTLCQRTYTQFPAPCLCTKTTIDCDHVVVASPFSPLAVHSEAAEYSHRFAGLTIVDNHILDLAQNTTGLRRSQFLSVDLSNNLIRKVGLHALDTVRHHLRRLNLSRNALGDQLNPIFSTSELQNLPSLHVLDLSYNDIRDMDESVLRDLPLLQELHMEGNDLRKVPLESLIKLSSLTVLNLRRNSLESLESRDFGGLTTVAELHLGFNSIRRINPGAFQDTGNITTLHLEYNLLTSLPSQAFQGLHNLQFLDLSDNFFDSVPSSVLSSTESLLELSLASNKIKSLDPDDFTFVKALQSLDLTRNSIMELPAGFLLPLKGLTDLTLDVNRIRRIDDMAFEGLEQLRTLSLSDNTILGIPTDALARVPKLHRFSLSYNRVAAIDATILQNLRNVTHLDLSYNLIRDVPQDTFSALSNLTSLSLEGNHLMSLHKNTLKGLEDNILHLDLGYNMFKTVPRLVFSKMLTLKLNRNGISTFGRGFLEDLPSLEHLDLADNHLGEFFLPAQTALKTLKLRDNNLTNLSANTFDNMSLEHLSISGNLLKELPAKTFTNLPNLTSLDLSRNRLTNIDANAFEGLPALRTLNLSRNDIVVFRGESLNTAPSLETLDLSSNHIHYLLPDSFTGCPNIESLDLSSNRLTVLVGEVLRSAPMLTSLNLANNVLQSVEEAHFSHLPRLRRLNISGNRVSTVSSRSFKNTSQLQDIDLSWNQLTSIPEDTFHGLLDLRVDLSRNSIQDLADDVFGRSHVSRLRGVNLAFNLLTRLPLTSMDEQYGNLEYLNVADNCVVHVPNNANILVNVKHIDLSGNPLSPESLSAILNEPKTARSIHLSHCGIETLPDLETPFLRLLNLSHNRITSIKPSTFNRATLLRNIDLSSNLLTDLDPSKDLFRDLEHLDVSQNRITSLSRESFQHSHRLKVLCLHRLPELKRLEAEAFDGLLGLRRLSLYGYPKMSFYDHRSILAKLPALESLDIEIKSRVLDTQLQSAFQPRLHRMVVYGSSITNLTSASFAGLSNPKLCIGVHETNLQVIPPTLVIPWPLSSEVLFNISNNKLPSLGSQFIATSLGDRQRRVTLAGFGDNPLRCDCGLFQLKQWMIYNPGSLRLTGNLTCREPPDLLGRMIISVADEDLTCERRSTTTVASVSKVEEVTSTAKPDDLDNVIEPDIIFETQSPGPDGYSTSSQGEDSSVAAASSLTNMDSIIIGVIVGVVAFICILIIVVCIVKLKHGQNDSAHRPGTLLVQSIVPYRFHPHGPTPCTCGKSPSAISPAGLNLCRCMPNYPPHPPHPPKLAITEGSLPRSGFYAANTPYYVTYPDSENDYR